ncbi:MAG: hypothetical protein E6J90_16080 [Deltaproteobacteria bacterium]|nr:MAG: hypothetical protein E6J91_31580 [Deltaproteobacteria bacterium]TMQ20515.1 MAG: hypothetical protein E6J90_16080 [Deltaproteobacteria bacterium]
MSAAQHILDQAYSLPRIEALAAEPGVYAARLREELPSAATLAALEARDAALARALGRIEAMVAAMRIRLDHALATDTSIGAPPAACSPRHRRRCGPAVAAHRASTRRRRARPGGRSGRDRPGRDRCGASGPRPPRRRDGVLALTRARRGRPCRTPIAARAIASSTTPSGGLKRDAPRDRGGRCRPDRVAGAELAARIAAHPAQPDEPEPGAGARAQTCSSSIEGDAGPDHCVLRVRALKRRRLSGSQRRR